MELCTQYRGQRVCRGPPATKSDSNQAAYSFRCASESRVHAVATALRAIARANTCVVAHRARGLYGAFWCRCCAM